MAMYFRDYFISSKRNQAVFECDGKIVIWKLQNSIVFKSHEATELSNDNTKNIKSKLYHK